MTTGMFPLEMKIDYLARNFVRFSFAFQITNTRLSQPRKWYLFPLSISVRISTIYFSSIDILNTGIDGQYMPKDKFKVHKKVTKWKRNCLMSYEKVKWQLLSLLIFSPLYRIFASCFFFHSHSLIISSLSYLPIVFRL